MTAPVVFIHGLFMTPMCWDEWVDYFTAKGYTCHALPYPFHDGEPAALRRTIDPALGKMTLGQVVESLTALIDRLPEKPILVGHSVGALVVQKLMAADRGVLGVCITPAPPRGIISAKWSFLRANLPTVNPLKRNQPCLPSVAWFHYAFCNTLSLEQTAAVYDALVVPESRNIPRGTFTADAKIDMKKPHRPMLFIGAEHDHLTPASLVKRNSAAYKDPNSSITFVQFAGRTHYIWHEDGWQEVAACVADYIASNSPTAVA